jgi:Ankyrin repeats (many copies)/Ankyrin repeats (3 copies)
VIDLAEASAALIRAACVPVDGSWHASGTLDEAQAILAAHPEVSGSSIHVAAILADDAGVRRFLALDPGAAIAPDGPYGWDPLTHLCFSRYLRLAPARSEAILRAAAALLDAGASANTGFYSTNHDPPEFESAIYGAAGVAHHPELTRLLLARGADPNDGETPYHAPETLDDRALRVLVDSGKVSADSLTTMLHRKLDWQHYEGVAWLLDHGADPNRISSWGRRALAHALGRTSPPRYFQLLLDHRADPTLPSTDGTLPAALAVRTGRADVLDLFAQHGFPVALTGDDDFLAACARGDEAAARTFTAGEPGLVARLQASDYALVADFAGAGNTEGVRLLLDLGFDLDSRTSRGGTNADPALHVAVWRGRLETVKLLVARGAPLEATNGAGATPLSLAVRALVEQSDWTPHASPEIVAALLDAGARTDTVHPFPSGSPAADALLRERGRAG